MAKFLTYSAVYGLLERNGQIYMMRRANTGYRDGQMGLPSGHVEAGEKLIDALVRELHEEAGVAVNEKDITFAHSLYRRAGERTYNDYFFTCTRWHGEPQVMEKDKCDLGIWVDKDKLPPETVEEVAHVVHQIQQGIPFSEIEVPGGHAS